jgi:hypothetical protein
VRGWFFRHERRYPNSSFASNGLFASKATQTDCRDLADGLDDRRPSRDLALDQPEKWLRAELVINLQTAKVLGLDVAPMLLACTDEVIE